MSQLVSKGEAPSTGVTNKLRFLLSSSPQHSPTVPLVSQHHAEEEEEEVPGGILWSTSVCPQAGTRAAQGKLSPKAEVTP